MGKTRVYVGNLPASVRERDIEDIFRKYGKIGNLDLRTNKGPPFAFLDFDDSRDADDAIHGRDGYDYEGYKIRVEYPRSFRDGDRRGGGGSRGGGYGGDRRGGFSDRGGDRRGFGGGGAGGGRRGDNGGIRRSKYRIVISGLPISGSWQDLKDHMREAGDVCFADVSKDGYGHVEFLREEDMKYAVKKLDDTKFRSHEGETAYIRIKIDETASSGGSGSGGSRRRSRSRSRSRSGSADDVKRDSKRSRSPVSRPSRAAAASPGANGNGDSNGKDRGSAKRERSPSRTPNRSMHSKSRSPSKSGGSRSASRERE